MEGDYCEPPRAGLLGLKRESVEKLDFPKLEFEADDKNMKYK